MNFNQRIREPQQGQGLTAQWLSKLLESVFGRIRGGNGIRVNRVGQNLIVEAIGGAGGGRGGGGGVIVVDAVGDLPEIASANALAIVREGGGFLYHRNGVNSLWVPANRWANNS